jgi:hypothetical protein
VNRVQVDETEIPPPRALSDQDVTRLQIAVEYM